VIATVPGPLLVVADVTLKNDDVEETAQEQPELVVTLIVAEPPTPAMLKLVEPRA
jgi:hypothetical protein